MTVFSPGPFPAPENGDTSIEGYARVRVVDGQVVKVLG